MIDVKITRDNILSVNIYKAKQWLPKTKTDAWFVISVTGRMSKWYNNKNGTLRSFKVISNESTRVKFQFLKDIFDSIFDSIALIFFF